MSVVLRNVKDIGDKDEEDEDSEDIDYLKGNWF